MPRRVHLVLRPLLVLLLAACANPHHRSTGDLVVGYLADRGGDLLDLVAADVGVGGWLGARVHAGAIAHVGVGYEVADRYGWRFGEPLDGRAERHLGLPACFFDGVDAPVPSLHSGTRQVPPSELGEPPRPHACWMLFPFLCDDDVKRTSGNGFLWGLDVEASVQLPGIGLRIGVSPGEALDFVAGFFGLDLAGDDTLSRPPSP